MAALPLAHFVPSDATAVRRRGPAFALLLVATLLHCGNPVGAASPWLEVDSDLPAHPDLHEGILPNGVRYVVLPNAEPRDRVSLRLLVAAGSAHENDDELGLAHFVEHMAYRGTRLHPAGSLTAALQRLGVGLGPDNTAFTSYDHTIYHLELPDASEATVREGLGVLREYAADITFEEKQVDRERGVLLAELATRDTPQARSSLANQRFLWPDCRLHDRPVGGTAATLRTFRREHFRSFYDAWYRPDRLAVIVVGTIDPAAVIGQIQSIFGPLLARGPARPEPAELQPPKARAPDVGVFADPGLVGVQIYFQRPRHVPRVRDTLERRVQALQGALAFAMFHERLQRLAQRPGTQLTTPISQLATPLRDWQVATVGASTRITDWHHTAAAIEQEHRRVFQHGFTAAELATARAGFAAAQEQAARSFITWPSEWVAGRIVQCLVTGTVLARPDEYQRNLAPALAAASLEDCLAAFREAWSTRAPHVFIVAHPSFAITRERIAEVLNHSRDRSVDQPVEQAAGRFAYNDFGPPGKLVRSEHHADLDVRLAAFANGVRLNFKATDFAANGVEICVRVGDGLLTQPEHQPGLALLANSLVMAGGLGRHTQADLTGVLAGRTVHVGFHVDSDALQFRAATTRRDLPLALQIVAAFLTDAAYRPEAMRDARAAFSTMYASLANTPGGVLPTVAFRDLAAGDRRFGTPHVAELFSRDIPELRAWIEPQFKRGPIELSIVGDISWEEAVAATARTLGALPRRGARQPPVRNPAFTIPAPPITGKSLATDPRLRQCALAWYWPIEALAGIEEERRLRLLTAVLHNRLHQRVREELGVAYSARADFTTTTGFPNYNFIAAYAEVPRNQVERISAVVQRAALELTLRGVPEDEFLRARQPFLRERDDNLRTNVYWGVTVLSAAQERPESLAAARSRRTDSESITRDDLWALAKRYLDPGRSHRYATVPTPAAVPAPPARGTAAGASSGRR